MKKRGVLKLQGHINTPDIVVPLELFNLGEVFKEGISFALSDRLESSLYFIKESALWHFNSETKNVSCLLIANNLDIPNATISHIFWQRNQCLLLGVTSKNGETSTLEKHLVLVELTNQKLKSHFSLKINIENLSFDDILKVAVSPGIKRVALGTKDGHILIFSLDQESPALLFVKAYENVQSEQNILAMSLLKFLDEDRLLSAHIISRNLTCWMIQNNELKPLWSHTQPTQLTLFHSYTLCILSDRILTKDHESHNKMNCISLDTGKIFDSITTTIPSITSITKINDDRVAICGGQGRLKMQVINVRTKISEWYCESKEYLSHYIPSQLFALSPNCLVSGDKLTAHLWKAAEQTQPFPITRYRFNKFNDGEYADKLIPMKSGRILVVQRDGNAFVCKPQDYCNPVEDNIERRTHAALCLACLVHTKQLTLDNIIYILKLITSGYESEFALKKISSASHRLAMTANTVVSRFFQSEDDQENKKTNEAVILTQKNLH